MTKRKKRNNERTQEERNGDGLKVTDYLRGCMAGYYTRGRDYIKMTNLEWLHELAREMIDAGIRVEIHESQRNKGHFALYRYTGKPRPIPPTLLKCGIPEHLWKVCQDSRCYNRDSCKIYKSKSQASERITRKLHKDRKRRIV